MKKKNKVLIRLLLAGALSVSAVAAAGVAVLPVAGIAAEEVQAATDYTLDAFLVAGSPGVYKTKARLGDNKGSATIGIPSVARQNLNGGPTTEEPAIIMGAAVNYETRTGATEFTPIPGAELTAPYSYFRWGVMDEQVKDADGNISTHKKLTGFDGSYYIIRVDVSDIIKDVDNPENKYLHVKQTDNKALMVASGIENLTFADALGNKTGSYPLANDAAALKDTSGNDRNTPYIDVIVMSSGKLVAGADTGKETAPTSDISLSFYVDDVADYNPDLKYDPASTDPDHAGKVLNKFFSDEKNITENNCSSYLIKGSDLEIDVMVDETESSDGVPEFASLTDALYYQPFDDHTIKLICEVPVLEGINIQGAEGKRREVILDVNSFDIQFANHSTTNAASLTVGNNTEFMVKDGSHTAGAELAIGNNAFMIIENGGTLVVDETCTVEVEYDAATTVDPAAAPGTDLFQGVMAVKDGGKVINYGVFNLEGTEAKPLDPNAAEQDQGQKTITDMKNSTVIVLEGGEFHNHGALSIKGDFELLGTLFNYGRYNDIIQASDPDKGTVTYHKGIQLTWKDDVRNPEVLPGLLSMGVYLEKYDLLIDSAVLDNTGDIVLAPGTINIYGTINNHDGGRIYINDAKEAVVPVTPTARDPMTTEIRVPVDPPRKSVLNVNKFSRVNTIETDIRAADVAVISNGHLGDLTVTGEAKGDVKDIKADDFVIYAKDFEKELVQGTDFVLKDGGVEFLPDYTNTFTGERTVTINIGFRYYYVTVKGTLNNENTNGTNDKENEQNTNGTNDKKNEQNTTVDHVDGTVPYRGGDKKSGAPLGVVKKTVAAPTGDSNDVVLWGAVAATATLVAASAVFVKRKKENR